MWMLSRWREFVVMYQFVVDEVMGEVLLMEALVVVVVVVESVVVVVVVTRVVV